MISAAGLTGAAYAWHLNGQKLSTTQPNPTQQFHTLHDVPNHYWHPNRISIWKEQLTGLGGQVHPATHLPLY